MENNIKNLAYFIDGVGTRKGHAIGKAMVLLDHMLTNVASDANDILTILRVAQDIVKKASVSMECHDMFKPVCQFCRCDEWTHNIRGERVCKNCEANSAYSQENTDV
jgi:hypothetical protein